jgi:hypothetical protein
MLEAIVSHVAALAQSDEIAEAVVGGIVVAVSRSQDDARGAQA